MEEERFLYSPQTTFMRNQHLLSSEIDEDLIMMDATQNSYFCLNSVGKAIWDFLDTPQTYTDLITQLTQTYDIDTTQCQQDIEPFLQALLKHQLIQVVS